jgi:conjugative transfer signal peptidase TraF
VLATVSVKDRAAALAGFLCALLIVVGIVHAMHIGFNVTDSMPVGFYRFGSLDRPVRAGDIVELCLPENVARVGLERGYLDRGSCPTGALPLVKIVVALGGDTVDITSDGISVNGHLLPGSAPQARDTHGRPMPRQDFGKRQLPEGTVWLWTPNPRSWDSRYWGPIAASNVIARATLLLAVEPWSFVPGR